MQRRIEVLVYSSDPIGGAGTRALLGESADKIELVGAANVDRARVAVVVAERADRVACRVIATIRRGGVRSVLVVLCHFDEDGVLAAVAAGATGFLRRCEADAPTLRDAVLDASSGVSMLPEALLRRAASVPVADAVIGGLGAGGLGAGGLGAGGLGAGGLGAGSGGADGREACSGLRESGPRESGPGESGPGESGPGESGPGESGTGVPHGHLIAGVGSTAAVEQISEREREILRLVASGCDTTEIAYSLSYSESTIKGELARVMTRLRARNRSHAVALALRSGLI